MKKNDKFVHFQEKQEVFTVKETTRVRLPEGKSFNLLPGMKFVILKEQTAASQTLGEQIVSAFNEALKDSVVKVKVVADDSSDIEGIKTTSITFEAFIDNPESANEEMVELVEFEFTPELDKVITDVLMEKFGFEQIESDQVNRFWISKIEMDPEKQPVVEEPVEVEAPVAPILSGGPEVEAPIAMSESEESDEKIEKKIEDLKDEKSEADKDEKKDIQKEINKLEAKLDGDDDKKEDKKEEEMKESEEEKTESELKKELEEKKDELADAPKDEKAEIKDEIAEIKSDLEDLKESTKPSVFKRAELDNGWL